jgi:hypothetical protein
LKLTPMQTTELKIKEGLGPLKFGLTSEQVKAIAGAPEEIDSEEIDEVTYTVWHYHNDGFSLFFDPLEDDRLFALEVSESEVELKGQPLFDLDESALKSYLKQLGFSTPETEKFEDGEYRLSYEDEFIDFHFDEDGQLLAFHMSVPIDEDLEFIWPA